MLTLDYLTLDNKTFLGALEKIDNTPAQNLMGKTVFDFNKIRKAVSAEGKKFVSAFQKIHEAHCEKDEDGKIKLDDQRRPVFKDIKRFEQDLEEFHSTTFDIKSSLLDREQVQKCGLTVKEMRACAPILTPSIKEEKDE
jgi:hypothetical protein